MEEKLSIRSLVISGKLFLCSTKCDTVRKRLIRIQDIQGLNSIATTLLHSVGIMA